MLNIEFETTKKDCQYMILEGTYLYVFKTMKGYYFFKTIRLILATIIIGIIFLTLSVYNFNLVLVGIPTFLLIFLIILISDLPYIIYADKIFNNIKKKNAEKGKITISDDFIKTESAITNFEFKWNGIKQIIKTQNQIIFLTITNIVFAIPKRIFNTNEEYNNTYEKILEIYNKAKEN